tara:strand:+ start:363 stop:788 length:426 start_codon:yes stop_codon:yes gene_type:complete
MVQLKELVLSGAYSSFWSVIFLFISYLLDFIMPKFYSTLIGYALTAMGNFVMQLKLFSSKGMAYKTMGKYMILSFIEMATVSIFGHYIMDHKKYLETKYNKYIDDFEKKFKKYYPTISRTISLSITFLIISYPLRKYWVFT